MAAASTIVRNFLYGAFMLLVWEQPPMTIGRGSFLSELVERETGESYWAIRRRLDEVITALEQGKLKKGSLVMLASVGAGFTTGATPLRWAY